MRAPPLHPRRGVSNGYVSQLTRSPKTKGASLLAIEAKKHRIHPKQQEPSIVKGLLRLFSEKRHQLDPFSGTKIRAEETNVVLQ